MIGCAVSIDLDEILHYRRIHGLAPRETEDSPVYGIALDRAARWAAQWRVPLTLFACGRDLERPSSALALQRLAGQGHLIENHSYGHRYDLTRLGRAEMLDEVERGADRIERAVGRRPEGFRAPGYTTSQALLEVVAATGARFDSSSFPCPLYYAAKAISLGWLTLRGRRSAAILDHPRVLAQPIQPYPIRVEAGSSPLTRLWELPIQVTPTMRLPVIGSSVSLAGRAGARMLMRACSSLRFINLELHALDFLDAADGLGDLASHQPELSISLSRRLGALDAALDELTRAGARFTTLAAAVDELDAHRPHDASYSAAPLSLD